MVLVLKQNCLIYKFWKNLYFNMLVCDNIDNLLFPLLDFRSVSMNFGC